MNIIWLCPEYYVYKKMVVYIGCRNCSMMDVVSPENRKHPSWPTTGTKEESTSLWALRNRSLFYFICHTSQLQLNSHDSSIQSVTEPGSKVLFNFICVSLCMTPWQLIQSSEQLWHPIYTTIFFCNIHDIVKCYSWGTYMPKYVYINIHIIMFALTHS